MSPMVSKVLRNTIFLIFAILFIAFIKVFFGGDMSLVSWENFGTAMLYIVPSSFLIAVGVAIHEQRKK